MVAVWALLAMLVAGVYLGVAARHGAPPAFHFALSQSDCPVLSDTSTCFSLALRNTSPTAASLVCTTQDMKTGDTVEFANALHEYHTGVISPGQTLTLGIWVATKAGAEVIGVPSVGCTT